MVGLSDRMDDPVATFSSGMKQRVKFAAALLARPAVLLLDEPRVNLDAAGLDMVDHLIDLQQQNGCIVIVATNDPHETERHNQIIRIEDFR
jgi:heme exporter protein A